MLFYGPISPLMKKAIKNFPADIIIGSPFPLNHMNYIFKNRGKAPVILVGCMHTSDKHGFKNPLIAKNIKRADGYIALTPHEKDYLVTQLGVPGKKIKVIGVGLKIDWVEPVREGIRKSLDIGKDAPLIAFVGQHGLHKGIGTLIASMPLVWRHFPRARLIIAGGKTPFTDGFKKLREFIDNERERKIFFLDDINEEVKSGIFSECDIFAAPSGFESFGITILEAWRRKKPVVACRISATMNLVEEYKTGLLVDYENARELAEAFVELISDEELRRKIGENGFKKLEIEFSWERVGIKYYDFYRGVVGH
jgi:glycosyltransferase involved in cell wall biosynthesis